MDLRQRRQSMYDAYAANLTATGKYVLQCRDAKDTFVCPICRNAFGRDALESPLQVSIEHCIPESLGGTLATSTLLCTHCNNTSGSFYDAQYAKQFFAEEFFQGTSDRSMPGQIEVQGAIMRGDWKFSNAERPRVEFLIRHERNHPNHLPEAKAKMKRMHSEADGAMTFTFPWPFHQWRARVALLRMAFLMMFRQFGYAYAFHPCAERVRNQILNPREEIIPDAFSTRMDDHPLANFVTLVTEPAGFRAFCVLMKFSSKRRTIVQGVLLPGPDDHGRAIYERLNEDKKAKRHVQGKNELGSLRSQMDA